MLRELKISLLDDLGDFQTPLELAEVIAARLTGNGSTWGRVLEPTCGEGTFLRALAPRVSDLCQMQGIELQPHYVERARQLTSSNGVSTEIHQGSIFGFRLDKDLQWRSSEKLLVIGNPPWVTNSALGSLESGNLPQKENLKGLSGFDALTGESNFDIAEYIWLKLIRELIEEHPTIALLCKTSVARNVLAYAHANNWPVIASSIHRINAKKWFNAAVDAALFTVEIGEGAPNYECRVYASLESQEPEAVMGFVAGRMVADLEAYRLSAVADGQCPFVWRQGIKHDAASVMELKKQGDTFTNKLGESVDIETEFLYPLLKSSDLYKVTKPESRWFMIVPQERVGQDTERLQIEAPKLWRYLCDHEEYFDKRKSSIYNNQPPFSVFGIGSYSFAPYKVAVAGLTKTPVFWPLAPVEGRPLVLDDTGYFLPCQTEEQAQALSSILNHPLCLGLLKSMTFTDSKRPITKKLLQRIDVMALLELTLEEPRLAEAKVALAPLLALIALPRSTQFSLSI
jgi:hypothetical protein